MITREMAAEAVKMRQAERARNFYDVAVRWYGPSDQAMGTTHVFGTGDPISLEEIGRVQGNHGIITALHGYAAGEVWQRQHIRRLIELADEVGLRVHGIESLPLHEELKWGGPNRKRYADAWAQSARNVGAEGIPLITYNVMPGPDWTRTDFAKRLCDGSTCLAFDRKAAEAYDVTQGFRQQPAWPRGYTGAEFLELRERYQRIGKSGIYENVGWFLEQVIPAVESFGGKMALHPDDPPEDVYGLPRAFGDEAGLAKLLELNSSPSNGLCFCTGALGANPRNDLVKMIHRFAKRIHFVHLRSVEITGEGVFHEARHTGGRVDLLACIRALYEAGFRSVVRPDHGRTLPGDKGVLGYGYGDRVAQAAPLLYAWGTAVQAMARSPAAGS